MPLAPNTRKKTARQAAEPVHVEGFLHPRIKCECGQMIADIKSSAHRAGVRHRRYRTMVRLLNSSCLTYKDIGDRLGLSRERIRQIANMMSNKTLLERRGACFASRAFAEWRAHANTKFLLNRGLQVRPVMRKGAHQRYADPSMRMFRVGNQRVLINSAWDSTLQPGRALRVCPTHKTTLSKVDLVLSRSPFGTFVFPANEYPSRGTTFILDPKRNPGRKKDRHDWPKYREAWHLITAAAAGTPATEAPANLPN